MVVLTHQIELDGPVGGLGEAAEILLARSPLPLGLSHRRYKQMTRAFGDAGKLLAVGEPRRASPSSSRLPDYGRHLDNSASCDRW